MVLVVRHRGHPVAGPVAPQHLQPQLGWLDGAVGFELLGGLAKHVREQCVQCLLGFWIGDCDVGLARAGVFNGALDGS